MRHCIIDSKAKYQCMVQYWIFLNDSRVTWQKYVRNSLHLNRFKGPGGVPLYLSSLFYRLLSPLFITPLPTLPLSLWNTITEMRGEVDCQQEGWKMTAGCDLVRLGEVSHQQVWMMTAGWRGVTLTASRGWRMSAWQRGWVWPLAGVDNDCLVERGEFDRQQGWNCWAGRGEFEGGWRMTAGWGGLSLIASGGEGWPPGERGWVGLPAGVEDDSSKQEGWKIREGWIWPQAGVVEDDRWVRRGEINC